MEARISLVKSRTDALEREERVGSAASNLSKDAWYEGRSHVVEFVGIISLVVSIMGGGLCN